MVAQVSRGGVASFLGRFSVLFAGRILGALALFCVNILIVRYLGTEALADYAVFTSMVSVLAIILFLGFNSVAPIFAAEYQTNGRVDLLKGFALTALRNGFVASLVLFIGLLTLWLLSIGNVAKSTLIYFTIVLLTAGGTALLGLNSAIQVGLKRPAMGQLPETLLRPAILLSLTAALLSIQLAGDISTVFLMACAAAWIAFLVIIFFDANFFLGYRSIASRTETRRWNKAALPWMGISLMWDFMIDVVILLTSLMAESVELAILHIAFRYRVLAGFGMRTIYLLFLPEITESSVREERAVVQRKLRLCNLVSLVYSLCVMAGFALIGHWLFEIFKLDASLGLPVLLTVSATMIIRAVFGPATLVLAINNSHLVTLVVSFVGLALNAVLLWLFYPAFGIMTAAIGYTVVNLFASAFLFYYARYKTGINTSLFGAVDMKPKHTSH